MICVFNYSIFLIFWVVPVLAGKLFLSFPVYNICRPSRGERCVQIFSCPYFADLLKNSPIPRNRNIISLIRNNQCGYDSGIPRVCCVETYTTSSELPSTITRTTLRTTSTSVFPENLLAVTEEPSIFQNYNFQSKEDRHDSELTQHKNYNLLPHEKCGPVSNGFRIFFGTTAALGEFPWMALIVYHTGDGLDFRCGGTIINERYILTAAHCILNSTIAGVRLGEYDIGESTDCKGNYCASPVQDFYIENFTVHPEYNETTLTNDIALIRLAETANFSYDNVQPICLPFQRYSLEGKHLIVSGWGVDEDGFRSAKLKKASVPIILLEDCHKIYTRSAKLTSKQICAGGKMGRDTCDGDSGGPLKHVDRINGTMRYVQYGIVSYGPRYCGADNKPAIYTRVTSYLNWILDNIEP